MRGTVVDGIGCEFGETLPRILGDKMYYRKKIVYVPVRRGRYNRRRRGYRRRRY